MTAAPSRPQGSPIDPAALEALLRELHATAEAIRDGMSGLAAAPGPASGRSEDERAAGPAPDRADATQGHRVPEGDPGSATSPLALLSPASLRRVLEAAPPELRERLAAAASLGLTATRDLADWLLAQLAPGPAPAIPQELPIRRAATPIIGRVTEQATWILTASVDNHRVTQDLGFSVVGIKERHRRRAFEMQPGDVVVLYLTKAMAFAGAVRITAAVREDRRPVWPGQPGNPDVYPWRLATEPIVSLPEAAWLPAEEVRKELEHVRKWPADHWTLAFQGQLRTVSDRDASVLLDRLQHRAAQPA